MAWKDLCRLEDTDEALESGFMAHMPPATRLTIRDPGIFTSIGYGTPCPTPFGMFFKPSLPFARWLHKRMCHYPSDVNKHGDEPPDKDPWISQTPI